LRTKSVGYSERVDVAVVQVTVTVTDGHGKFIRDVPQSSFHVLEDGHPQAITHFASEDVPLELVAAVDISGSMASAMPRVKSAVKQFLGEVPPQAGNFHPTMVPAGTFRAKDGSLNVQASSNGLFGRLCGALGAPELATDPRYRQQRDRQQRREELGAEIERLLAQRTVAEWVEILNNAGVPAGPILDVRQCFDDPQVRCLPLDAPVEHPHLGTLHLLGFGVNLNRTPARMRSAAPEHGAQTEQILCELGYSAEEIESLRRAGAI